MNEVVMGKSCRRLKVEVQHNKAEVRAKKATDHPAGASADDDRNSPTFCWLSIPVHYSCIQPSSHPFIHSHDGATLVETGSLVLPSVRPESGRNGESMYVCVHACIYGVLCALKEKKTFISLYAMCKCVYWFQQYAQQPRFTRERETKRKKKPLQSMREWSECL